MKKTLMTAILLSTVLVSCGTSKKSFSFPIVTSSKAQELYSYNKEYKIEDPGQDAFNIKYMMEGSLSDIEEKEDRFYSYRRKNITENDKLYLTYVNEKRVDSILKLENIEDIKKEVFGGSNIDLSDKNLINGKYIKLHKHLFKETIDDNLVFLETTVNEIEDIKIKENGFILADAVRETTSLFSVNLITKNEINKTFTYLTPIGPFSKDTIKDNCLKEECEYITIPNEKIESSSSFDEEQIFIEAKVTTFNNEEAIMLPRYINRGERIDLLEKDFSSKGFDTTYDFYDGYKDLLLDAYLSDKEGIEGLAYFELDKIISSMK